MFANRTLRTVCIPILATIRKRDWVLIDLAAFDKQNGGKLAGGPKVLVQ